jgi:hypothetical protein
MNHPINQSDSQFNPWSSNDTHIKKKQFQLPDGVCLSQLHLKLTSSSKEEFDQNCSDLLKEIYDIIKA